MRTGYRLALAIAGATLAIALALTVVGAVKAGRDADAYGSAPVPGRDSVTLPAGEVIVFYGEANGSSPLRVPASLRLSVRTTNGEQLVGSTPYASEEFTDGDYLRRSIAKLDVPEAGQYEALTPTRVPGAVNPLISFGREGTRSFAYVLFALAGGLLLAAILAAGTALRVGIENRRA